jgi:leucyl/phenylalanyl-tRNA--protein transferase
MRPSPQSGVNLETLLRAYAMGVFPMSDGRADPDIHWVDPRRRGILPINGPRLSRSLARRIARGGFQITADTDFAGVVMACADRPETWISDTIARLYHDLFDAGHAHSLEVWKGTSLIGGVYGVSLGAAFFGESMFSRTTDGSKIALVFLLQRLRAGGFTLFDTQFLTPHLARLGGIEVSRATYHSLLADALKGRATFDPTGYQPDYSLGTAPVEGSGSSV